ncbi:class I SAM-dependent methyltransferase [Cyanobium sp. HWJ4-Hawea]|uniref:class I SAM-dependent methyltransferase n=1 Tax=Cyanobium sp. HWJ4-Hawea TaxID=2823713 RepID=UPI0020CD40F1|nr:class I SAM-dependent methyltransferase [Cyanobium sp. HWJ4-Hawea]MCP9808759.1 class I SAM-dependent methyltransferase [Cyanobium sp. HWJ4-Hawea]
MTDHFKNVAQYYGEFRPKYPQRLFELITEATSEHQHAWDCATGSGQAAVALAGFFERVTATDASAAQLEQSEPHWKVAYRVAPAEASGLASRSVDAITVAQALHWFPLDAFFQECERVLKPGGILAIWTYSLLMSQKNSINQIIQHYYRNIVGPYWPPQRALVDDCYRSIQLPFKELNLAELRATPLAIQENWTLAHLKGYLRSWSASGYLQQAQYQDPLESIREELDTAWGEASQEKTITWPLTLRITKKP